jgi:hypothetical protein
VPATSVGLAVIASEQVDQFLALLAAEPDLDLYGLVAQVVDDEDTVVPPVK